MNRVGGKKFFVHFPPKMTKFSLKIFIFSKIFIFFPGNISKSLEYQLKFDDFRNTFQEVFYVKNASGWYDFNLRTGKHNLDFYPSIATPLFTQCYYTLDKIQSDDLFDKMEELGVFHFNGGIPTR